MPTFAACSSAAQYILGPFASDSDLRRHGSADRNLWQKQREERAVVAVACRPAMLVHHLWRTREVYEPLHNASVQATAA